MPQRLIPFISIVFTLSLASIAPAQFEDDEESYLPGLLARYQSGERIVTRIDSNLAFVWTGDGAPAQGLPAGPFSAEWSGGVLVRLPGTYRLHLYLQGQGDLVVDGETLISADRDQPGWESSQPVALSYGEHALEVRFRSSEAGSQLKLFWSSPAIRREPIPATVLFRSKPHEDLQERRRGGVWFEALRCGRCHASPPEATGDPAPALTHLGGALPEAWIVDWLSKPDQRPESSLMPQYDFTGDEARAIAAFLVSASKAPELTLPEPAKDQVDQKGDLSRGKMLFRATGCLACHRRDGQGTAGPFGGGDLTGVGRKRSAAWLATWLAEPEKLNEDHRMPVFELTDEQRRQLALYLAGPSGTGPDDPDRDVVDEGLIANGKTLVERGRCAACHRLPGIASATPAKPLQPDKIDWENSCLSQKPDRRSGKPVYHGVDRPSLIRYVESLNPEAGPLDRFEQGRLTLRRRNCLACHPRDLEPGIVAVAGEVAKADASLAGDAQVLIPPHLTAVGDRLQDAALAEAVLGRQERRLPWLTVRMPRFALEEAEQANLVDYLIGHDRIPALDAQETPAQPRQEAEQLIAGHELVGGKGFSCVSCHKVGTFEPSHVALGTRGSDLLNLGGRMRREFFLRWTRSPLRVVPGVEMPSYDRPVPGLLEGDLDEQLVAVWEALNDPNFTAPTNPEVVEQYWVVGAGEPARVLRDVFTMPPAIGGQGSGAGGQDSVSALDSQSTNSDPRPPTSDPPSSRFVPRAFAVGLNNGHNLLVDLDSCVVRGWWYGDFARQRTQGKTWLWEIAGIPLASDATTPSGFVLVDRRGAKPSLVLPEREHATLGSLESYERHGDGVRLRYRLNLSGGESLAVTETIGPVVGNRATGWKRHVRVANVPAGFDVYVVAPSSLSSAAEARVETAGGSKPSGADFLNGATGFDGRQVCRLTVSETEASASGEFDYLAKLEPERLELKETEPLLAEIAEIPAVPGYEGVRLPMATSIMPSALTWMPGGRLALCSLKGDVYLADDSDGDGLEDRFLLFEEGLAAPYGLLSEGDALLVSHKPEVLRLRDTDGDGRADLREVVATGWGYNDNYHDWTMGLSRDSHGNLYVGLGSDYAQKGRPRETTRWRGKLLRIDPSGHIEPLAHALRYPTGIALDSEDRVFISDNQGVGNTFNEINHLVEGHHYGVPSLYEEDATAEADWPAIQVPHPWTRSINGLFFLPRGNEHEPFAGHGIGCEINGRFLVRFTYEQVDGVVQGAVYPFSSDVPQEAEGAGGAASRSIGETFLGPLSGGVSPAGDIYVASVHDSGWMGGRNEGEIVKLRRSGELPLGIREIRATPRGFLLDFTAPVDSERAARVENYAISGYTRVWQGAYATPDSERHRVEVLSARVSPNHTQVELVVDKTRPKFVYEITCGKIGPKPEVTLWPAIGHYTMRRVPKVIPEAEARGDRD